MVSFDGADGQMNSVMIVRAVDERYGVNMKIASHDDDDGFSNIFRFALVRRGKQVKFFIRHRLLTFSTKNTVKFYAILPASGIFHDIYEFAFVFAQCYECRMS